MRKKNPEALVSGFYLKETGKHRVRLDVDGDCPQSCISGVFYFPNNNHAEDLLYWYARLTWNASTRKGAGKILYKFWNKNLTTGDWHTDVQVEVLAGSPQSVMVTFQGGPYPQKSHVYKYNSPYFQHVSMEFDYQKGFPHVLQINPKSISPNNPGELPDTLTLEDVFAKTGYGVLRTGKDEEIEVKPSPDFPDPTQRVWQNGQLHDIMMEKFSLAKEDPQVMALWAFSTTLGVNNNTGLVDDNLLGRMFDLSIWDKNKKPRQGCALFNQATILTPSYPKPLPPEYIRVWKFFNTIHEIGHCLNLEHSWEKTRADETPWLPQEVKDEPDSLSFMNYPVKYAEYAHRELLKDTRYRFSNQELFFLRHAPKWFLRPGDNDYGSGHARMTEEGEGALSLVIETLKPGNVFQFMEPVLVQVQLKNTSKEPVSVHSKILEDSHHCRFFVRRGNEEPRAVNPFYHSCYNPANRLLKFRDSLKTEACFSFGSNGWLITEPGNYKLWVNLVHDGQAVTSNVISIRVLHPVSEEMDILAQDYFSDEVARVLFFEGSYSLKKANNVLTDLAERLKGQDLQVLNHALLAIHLKHCRFYPVLERKGDRLVIQDKEPSIGSLSVVSNLLSRRQDALGHTIGIPRLQRYKDLLDAAGRTK